MIVFLTVMVIVLTVSNVLLWIVCKGMQIMIKSLADKTVELCECIVNENHIKR